MGFVLCTALALFSHSGKLTKKMVGLLGCLTCFPLLLILAAFCSALPPYHSLPVWSPSWFRCIDKKNRSNSTCTPPKVFLVLLPPRVRYTTAPHTSISNSATWKDNHKHNKNSNNNQYRPMRNLMFPTPTKLPLLPVIQRSTSRLFLPH